MKKTFLFMLAVVVSTVAFAQMQVWSNGTIIFSHDQTDVDSISFGSPMHVQTNMNAAITPSSLAGTVYTSSWAGASNLYTLCFVDDNYGYYTFNSGGHTELSVNKATEFTYSISGSNITIYIDGKSRMGQLIGRNGIVMTNWYTNNSNVDYPATFLNYNR